MDFTNLFASKIETASQTIGAINCFSEWVSSKFNDLANFVSGIGNYASVYIQDAKGSLEQKLAIVPLVDYEYAVENPNSNIAVKVRDDDSNLSYITVKGSDLTDAFDEQLSNLRCQEQFIQYCLNVSSTNVSDFMTRVKTVSPSLSGAVIDKYSRLIEISGSPLECLKNFFSQYRETSVTHENQYISLTDPSSYVGNMWVSAFSVIADTITGFFEGAWQGIRDLGGFFDRVLKGVIKLSQWIVSHAFHELTTVYDKACDASIGIMDLPIFQFYGTVTEITNFIALLGNNTNRLSYAWDGYNHSFNHYRLRNVMTSSLQNLIVDTYDGVSYDSVCEVVVPASPCDLSLRLGKTVNGQICLSCYIISDYGSWSKYSDSENNDRIYYSLKSGLQFISSIIPMVSGKQDVDDTSVKWNEITEELIVFDGHATSSLVELLRHPSTNISLVSDNNLTRILGSCFVYMCLMSKGFMNENGEDCTDEVITLYIFNPEYNVYSLTTTESDIITALDKVQFDVTTYGKRAFKPYAKRNQLPVSVHYQTTNERAKEIISAILKIIVAAVAVVSTVKVVKWSKKRRKETLLAHAEVDKLSWDVAANPTAENINKFNQAYQKSKRMDFVNGILGTVSPSGGASSSLLGSVLSIAASASSNSAKTVDGIASVKSNVTGIATNVDGVSERVTNISNDISSVSDTTRVINDGVQSVKILIKGN